MLKHYFVLSIKVLLRRKFFTFISIFGISFTLLVLLVLTALLDHMFAPMAPETRQNLTLEARRAILFTKGSHVSWNGLGSFTLFDRFARNLPGVERLSIYSDTNAVVSYRNGRKIVSDMKRTDGEFWKILDFTFLEGRPYSVQEVGDGAMVAVINATTRERFFDGVSAVGQTIEANGQRFRVVGVVEDVSTLRDVPASDIWTPYTTLRSSAYRTATLVGNFKAIALASSRDALTGIRDEYAARVARIAPAEYAESQEAPFTTLVSAFESKFDAFARNFPPLTDETDPNPQGGRLLVLFAAMALLFILLPTVNLVNINISRILERTSEIGIRKAFGASSRTLIGQFIIENVILSIAGGIVGLLLSVFVLRAITNSGVIPHAHLAVNWRVFGYGLLLAVVFGLISGVYPAWRMSRLHPADALQGGRR